MEKEKLVSLLLRLGLAFSFLYVAFASFVNPLVWIGYFPSWLQSDLILYIFSIYEIILGLWLIFGKGVFYSAILSAFTLLGIIVFNFGAFDIVFRDVPILVMAVVLAILSYKK